MAPMREWKGVQWTTVVIALGAIVLVARALVALQGPLEPFLPATREYVREQVKFISDGNEASFNTMKEAIATAEGNTEDLKILILQGQLQNVNAEINMIDLRLKATPQDALVQDLLRQYMQQRDDVQGQLTELRCRQLKRTVPDAKC